MYRDAVLAEKIRIGEINVEDTKTKRAIPPKWQCKNNCWVKCRNKTKCEKCGWNPEVAEKRIENHGKQRSEK